MILQQETKTKFGYFPEDLVSGSHKKILVSCDYCKNILEKENYRLSKMKPESKHCCKNCKVLKAHETISFTPGLKDQINSKRAITNIKKYGTIAPANNDKIQQKIQATNQIKYGTTHAIESPLVRAKIKESMIANHGVQNPFELQKFQDKGRATIKERYGRNHGCQIHMSEDAIKKLQDKDWLYNEHVTNKKCLTHIAKDLGLSETSKTIGDYCKRHGIEIQKYNTSIAEFEILEFIKSLGIQDVVQSDRTAISPKELDVYSPSKKIAIEYCGLYWHSEEYLPKSYHKDKLAACNKAGIRLITIFEDEWKNKPELVKNRIKYAFGASENSVFARKCELVEQDCSDFLESNHIQGSDSSSLRYTLIDPATKEIVAAMTFGRPRFNKHYEWELIRYASKGNVIGGASKLFSHFIEKQNPNNVISYCDLRWGAGNLYLNLGFSKIEDSEPGFFWVINDKTRVNRLKFTRERMIQKDPTKYDKSKSVVENLKAQGILRIFDCGHSVYRWTKTP